MMHENEKKEQFKSYVSFYKSIIDQDRCDLQSQARDYLYESGGSVEL